MQAASRKTQEGKKARRKTQKEKEKEKAESWYDAVRMRISPHEFRTNSGRFRPIFES